MDGTDAREVRRETKIAGEKFDGGPELRAEGQIEAVVDVPMEDELVHGLAFVKHVDFSGPSRQHGDIFDRIAHEDVFYGGGDDDSVLFAGAEESAAGLAG